MSILRNLNFKYIAAYNFLCFGPEGIQLDLTTLGKIVLILGKNWDTIDPITEKPGSNGTGKSCIHNIFLYALFGKLSSTDVKQADMIHKEAKKKLKVEVIWDKYRVVRTRKPDTLRLWESEEGVWNDDTEISCGAGAPVTQKKIESILGMNLSSFIGITLFDDKNDHNFLEFDTPTKRASIENLLSLDRYREYNKVAKVLKLEAEKIIKVMSVDYDQAISDVESLKRRVFQIKDQKDSWKDNQQLQIDRFLQQILTLEKQMNASDNGAAVIAYNAAQEKIAELNQLILADAEEQSKLTNLENIVRLRKTDHDKKSLGLTADNRDLSSKIIDLANSIQLLQKEINSLESLTPGVTCGSCYGIVDPANAAHVIKGYQDKIIDLSKELDTQKQSRHEVSLQLQPLLEESKKLDDYASSISGKLGMIAQQLYKRRNEISSLGRLTKPETSKDEALVEQRIADLKDLVVTKRAEMDGPSPYDRLFEEAQEELGDAEKVCMSKKEEIVSVEGVMPYYRFWTTALGDSGIRSFVIDDVLLRLSIGLIS